MLAAHVSPVMAPPSSPPEYSEAELALIGAKARIAALQAEIQMLIRRYPRLLEDFPEYRKRSPQRAEERAASSRRQKERWARFRFDHNRPLKPGDREVLESMGIKVERRRADRSGGEQEAK